MSLLRASDADIGRSSSESTEAAAARRRLAGPQRSVRQGGVFSQQVVKDWNDVVFYWCRFILRTKGARNARFEERRSALLDRLKTRLTQRGAMRPTLRELAAAAGCSVSTLAHYFGRRDDIVRAVFAEARRRSEVQLAPTRRPASGFAESVHEVAALSWQTLTRQGVAGSLAMGMVEGMGDDLLGPCFIDMMFEPFIIALTERLDVHVARGEMRPVDTRMAALALASPLLMGALHQGELGGARLYPLNDDAFLAQVADGFIRAYRAG